MRLRRICVGFAAFFGYCLAAQPALAIPSPELIVGSFVSLSQLIALASAVLGGGAAYATMRVKSSGASAKLSRRLLYVAAGLFAVTTVSIGFNIFQYVTDSNARQARLEATLVRPTAKADGKTLDPSLKEASYEDQQSSPHGISGNELEALLEAHARGERTDSFLLDIRENAETEMGILPGARTVRFPDIKSSNIDFKGKTAVLYCHNGNRSYETCQALAAMGIDCRFLVGGLEKWIVERRPLTGLKVRTLGDLRAVPAHRNQSTLLDTTQVRRLIDNENAVLVDVRYPGEFKNDHIPGAISVPMRPTPTVELKTKIAQLPKQPIVVPCYDRRSCFFGEVLGLELDRQGYDYRGRYTVPWEYFKPGEPRPYIRQWMAEAGVGWFAKSGEDLAAVLSTIADRLGLVLTIILLACLSRLAILSFSVKAERDHMTATAAAGEMDAIKTTYKDDPVRKSRAIRAFYKRHGITPGRNLIALAFLPIMAVALASIRDLADQTVGGLGWIPSLAGRDPLLILPVVFGVIITLYADIVFGTSRPKRIAIWVVGLTTLVTTGAVLGAAADIYLITSAILLVIQRLSIDGTFARLLKKLRQRNFPKGAIALSEPDRLTGCGNKAYRLALLRSAGLPVPDGIVLTPDFVVTESALDWLWSMLGKRKLAVRSSGSSEDGANHSFAGVFESVLDVQRDTLACAIAKVSASFVTARAATYKDGAGAGNILVQQMVEAQYAGVLFTRDPSAGALSMVEMVEGTADKLVSGAARAQTFRFGRATKMQTGRGGNPPIDFAPLLALGDRAEAIFGRPQDIEWTFLNGSFNLVQSRDITAIAAGEPMTAAMQKDLARVSDFAKGTSKDEIVFGKNEMSEMLPRPTPLSLSLMETLWQSGGSVDTAARELGLTYRVEEGSPYLVTILGRLYVDKREERNRALVIGPLAAKRLIRTADRIERDFREVFLPRFRDGMRLPSRFEFDKLPTDDLVAEIKLLHDRFTGDTHVAVDVINIAAWFYLDQAKRALSGSPVDPSAVLGSIPDTCEMEALAEIRDIPQRRRRWLMLKHFGHRSALDYELASPRYGEDVKTLEQSINARVAGMAQLRTEGQLDLDAAADAGLLELTETQSKLAGIARTFQTLKEDAKHHSLTELAALRRAVLALDSRLSFEGLIFFLRFDELLSLTDANAPALRETTKTRKAEADLLAEIPSLQSSLTAQDIERASAGDAARSQGDGGIRGTWVAGSKSVVSKAHVVSERDAEAGNPLKDFQDGDIVVSAMVSPAWLPYFSRAGGFVSEVGGWLSHPAILAREYDLPMIIGADGLTSIKHGDRLKLHMSGQVELIVEVPQTEAATAGA